MRAATHTIRPPASKLMRALDQDDAHAHAVVELADLIHRTLPALRGRIRGATARNLISAAVSALSAAHAESRNDGHPDRVTAGLHMQAVLVRLGDVPACRVDDDNETLRRRNIR